MNHEGAAADMLGLIVQLYGGQETGMERICDILSTEILVVAHRVGNKEVRQNILNAFESVCQKHGLPFQTLPDNLEIFVDKR